MTVAAAGEVAAAVQKGAEKAAAVATTPIASTSVSVDRPLDALRLYLKDEGYPEWVQEMVPGLDDVRLNITPLSLIIGALAMGTAWYAALDWKDYMKKYQTWMKLGIAISEYDRLIASDDPHDKEKLNKLRESYKKTYNDIPDFLKSQAPIPHNYDDYVKVIRRQRSSQKPEFAVKSPSVYLGQAAGDAVAQMAAAFKDMLTVRITQGAKDNLEDLLG